MKKLFLIIALVSVGSLVNAQDKSFAREVIDSLTSPQMHGRGYVNNGDGIAADYIAGIFDSLGIEKVNGSYFQKFNIGVNTLPGHLRIVLEKEELKPGIDFLMDPGSPAIKGRYQVHLLTEEELQRPNEFLSSLKKSDKTFLVFPYDEKPHKNVVDLFNFLKFEPSSPIAGIIQLTKNKLTWYGSTMQNAKPVIVLNEDRYNASAEKITLNIEAEYVEQYQTQNVIGKLTGKSDSTIFITAHYDHLGRMGKKVYFPGANDNASGTAFLLDLARHYSQKDSLEYTLVFIAFAAEEVGILGSQYYVENPVMPLNKIKFLLNFDLAGTGDEGIQVVNGSEFKDKFDLLTELNDQHDLLPQVKIRGSACNSDHCPFYKKGVPGFFIYTLGGIKAYHDVDDKAETLPLTEYEDYFKLMTKFIDRL